MAETAGLLIGGVCGGRVHGDQEENGGLQGLGAGRGGLLFNEQSFGLARWKQLRDRGGRRWRCNRVGGLGAAGLPA